MNLVKTLVARFRNLNIFVQIIIACTVLGKLAGVVLGLTIWLVAVVIHYPLLLALPVLAAFALRKTRRKALPSTQLDTPHG